MSALNSHPIILGYIQWNNFGKHLGMDFTIVEAGVVEYRLEIMEMHLATTKASHGGVQAALMDAVLGVAALSEVCSEGKVVSTVSLNVNYLSPAFLGDTLFAKAKVIKRGKSLLFTHGEIYNQNGKCLVTASATMNAYPVEKLQITND